jgi:hypothetical protein
MTPAEMTTYLEAMRRAGCLSAEVVLPGGAAIRAVFGPDMGEAPGDPIDKDPEPGAWKWKGDQS